MKRKPLTQEPSDRPDEVKYSIIVPIDLDDKMQKICKIKKYNRSMLLRELMNKYLDRLVQESHGEASVEGDLTMHLNEETRRLLAVVSHDSNLSPSAVVQLLVTRSLPAFVQETRSLREQVASLLDEDPAAAAAASAATCQVPPKGKGKRA